MLEEIKPFLLNTIDLIFPPQCLSCRNLVDTKGNLCPPCWEGINFITSQICNICGFPFELQAGQNSLCGQCTTKKPSYAKARAVFIYDKNSRNLITSFKYSDKIHFHESFAKWMTRVGIDFINQSDIIVPVPLHRVKLFTRRYNQSALLAKSISKTCRLPAHNDLLIRKKNTKPQSGLLLNQRFINMRGVFKLNTKYKDAVKNKNVILIDDVMTTGATIESCTKTLIKAGATNVNVLTLARAIKG